MIFFLYQSILFVAGPLYLLVRSLRGKPLPGIRERLACYPKELEVHLASLQRPIWLHLVSVGEALAAQPLVAELRKKKPESSWVITTVTPTGREVAKKLIRGPQDALLYLPWDFSWVVRRAIRKIRPQLFISFETELWPVLFERLKKEGVPILVVNGRISPAAYGRYLWARPFMGRVLAMVDLVLTQSPEDARRFAALGAPKDRIVVMGNLKWDLPLGVDGEGPSVRSTLSLSPQEIFWIAGSTHPGEEKIILESYKGLKDKFPSLKLLIAPRHPQRVPEVEGEVARLGLQVIRRSRLTQGPKEDRVILLDTLGELSAFYKASDIVFVGGSLVPHGGHNLIEPACASRPILTGPYLHNFQAVAESLQRAGALTIVRSGEELVAGLQRLIEDPSQRLALGKRAFAAIAQHRGATDRTVQIILQRYLR